MLIYLHRPGLTLVSQLLTRDPTRRLGSSKTDAEEIKRHPFFKDVNFDDILHKKIPPPYFPAITSATDTSNFDSVRFVWLSFLLHSYGVCRNLHESNRRLRPCTVS